MTLLASKLKVWSMLEPFALNLIKVKRSVLILLSELTTKHAFSVFSPCNTLVVKCGLHALSKLYVKPIDMRVHTWTATSTSPSCFLF